jgi:hypothetical protein
VEEAIVHRKGATPAGQGSDGCDPRLHGRPRLRSARQWRRALHNSAAHGARQAHEPHPAFKSLSEERWREHLGGARRHPHRRLPRRGARSIQGRLRPSSRSERPRGPRREVHPEDRAHGRPAANRGARRVAGRIGYFLSSARPNSVAR